MENKTYKIIVNLLLGMVGFGLGMIAVSMFLSFMDVNTLIPMPGSNGTMNASLNLFAADWDSMDASPILVILAYLVLLVGLIMMAVDASVRQKLKKKAKGLNFAALAISAIGFIFYIVAVVVTKNDVENSMNKIIIEVAKTTSGGSVSDQELMLAIKMLVSYKLGTGSIMTIIGGVVALIGSVLLVLPIFDPIKIAAEQAPATPAPTADATVATADTNAATADQPEPAAEANDNNNTVA